MPAIPLYKYTDRLAFGLVFLVVFKQIKMPLWICILPVLLTALYGIIRKVGRLE